MTEADARRFINDFYYSDNPDEEVKFLFEEAMRFLINRYHKPADMHDLASFYLVQRRHDLELKYLEMAAEYDFPPAFEALGYIWYYGQTGQVDYEKAFKYFNKGAESEDDVVRCWTTYKLADMYHNGFYVSKDEERFVSMIEGLAAYMANPGAMNSAYGNPAASLPNSEVITRLAQIRADQGRTDEAKKLIHNVRTRLGEEIRGNPTWWGNIENMEEVVKLGHEIGAVRGKLDIYDLFWMAERECTIAFLYGSRRFLIEVVADRSAEDEVNRNVIKFDGKWFRTVREFLEKAEIDGKKIVFLYDALQDMEVNYG
jgi:Sel1 repeat.